MTELCNDNKYGQKESAYTTISRDTSEFNPVQISRVELQERALTQFGLQLDDIQQHQLLCLTQRMDLGHGLRGLQYQLKTSKEDPFPSFGRSPGSMKRFIKRLNGFVAQKSIGFVPDCHNAQKTQFFTSNIMWAKGVLSVPYCLCSSPLCPAFVPSKSHLECKEKDGTECIALVTIDAKYVLCQLCLNVVSDNDGARKPHVLQCLQNKTLAKTWSPPMCKAVLEYFDHCFGGKSQSARLVTTVSSMQTWFADNQMELPQKARIPVPKEKLPKKRRTKKSRNKKSRNKTIKLMKKSNKNGKLEM